MTDAKIIPDGDLGPVIRRMAAVAPLLAESIAEFVPEDGDPTAYAIVAGIFAGIALFAKDDALCSRLRAWSIGTGAEDYAEAAHYILTGEQPEKEIPA